jgi:uncharacterized protein (TIGR00299 family) protein
MVLGSLLDLGMPIDRFEKEINKLKLTGYKIVVERIPKNHISALDVYIHIIKDQPHRSYKDIKKIISKSLLRDKIKEISIKIFKRLAEAEGKIHQTPYELVHFHEVGAIDSIIDIVGSVILLDYYKIKKIYASPLPLGKGFVNCAHGRIPIPAPATLEILKNIPIYQTDRNQELVTPTGAAIISTVASSFGEMPQMQIEKLGYGAGKTESIYPNLLRIVVGKTYLTKRK